jgi:hypothetical protein
MEKTVSENGLITAKWCLPGVEFSSVHFNESVAESQASKKALDYLNLQEQKVN